MPNGVPALESAQYIVSRSIEHREGKLAGSSGQEAAVLSSHRASRHVPSASLGQDASLSFVVIGREQRTEIFLWERLSPS